MKRSLIRYITILLTIGLGLIFTIAGLTKLLHPADFLSSVYSYGFLSEQAGFVVAGLIPCVELVIGLSMLAGRVVRGALLTAVVVLVLFVVAQIIVLIQGTTANCGCAVLMTGDEPISAWTIARTAVLAVLAGAAYAAATYEQRGPDAADASTPARTSTIVTAATLAIGCLPVTSARAITTADDNGAPRVIEAAEHLGEIFTEQYHLISPYLFGTATAPSAEVRRIQAEAAGWLVQLRRGMRADTVEFPMPVGGLLDVTAVPITELLVAGEMEVFHAHVAARAGDPTGAGSALLSTARLMEYMRSVGAVDTASVSQSLGTMIGEFTAEPALIGQVPVAKLTLLEDAFDSLPANDPFGHLDAFRQEQETWIAFATNSRETPEGSTLLAQVGEFVHPSLAGMTDMTEGEFALTVAQAEQFFAEVDRAVNMDDADDATAALASLQDRAWAGEFGPFAAVMCDPQFDRDLSAMRGRIDESETMVQDLLQTVRSVIASGPAANAAEFYIAAAELVNEAEAAGADVLTDSGRKYAADILALMQAGTACTYCDFTAYNDFTAFTMPAYAPGLRKSIKLISQSDDEPHNAVQLLRIAHHLAGDGTFGGSAVAFHAARDAVAMLQDARSSHATWEHEVRDAITATVTEFDERDPLGWDHAVFATRLAWRAELVGPMRIPPEPDWQERSAFAMASEASTAWLGLLSTLTDPQQELVFERLVAYDDACDIHVLRATVARARELIGRAEHDALADIEVPTFDALFPTAQARREVISELRDLVNVAVPE